MLLREGDSGMPEEAPEIGVVGMLMGADVEGVEGIVVDCWASRQGAGGASENSHWVYVKSNVENLYIQKLPI